MESKATDFLQSLIVLSQQLILATVILLIIAALAVAAGHVFLRLWKYRKREVASLDFCLLEVAVPRDNEIKIDAAEQMFASLYALKFGGRLSFLRPQEHLTFEIVGKTQDIRFYVSAPNRLRDLVEKQIHGAYPGAEIKVVDEYNIFSEEGKVAFASLKLRSPDFYPIKIYKDLPTDPLSAITSVLAKMGEDEGAAVQILISPADSPWQKNGRKYVSRTKKQEADPEKAKFNVDQKTLEQIDGKCSKPGFNTVIRLVVCSASYQAAKMHLDNLKASFEQFSADTNGFRGDKHRLKKLFMFDFIYRYHPLFGKPSVLNSEELATVFHFPNKQVETPHIFWLNARRAPAPAQVPYTGLYLGKSTYRGITRPVCISKDDRRRHIYIVGKTGVGKSWLLRDMILQDIREGKGVCFIDPHDTYEQILEMMPPERAEDVVYFDPSDTERPMGLNLLEANTEDQKHLVINSIIGLMYKLYDPHQTGIIGPRFEHAIRNAMLTVMSEPGSTFIEVMRCLQDPTFVQELLPKVTDPIVRRYWTDQIAQTSDFHKSEVLDYIVSKFGRFVTNKLMRNIIGQSKSAFDFRKCMDEGKILIINLAKGSIGEENSSFLGLVMVPKILIAAMSRQDVPEEARRDFYLYVDEFQNFATPDFATILSEARKYRLSLAVANQFTTQMEENIRNAVFGNVGTLISFRVGVADANFLQREFQPVFSEVDLLNVEAYHAYIKTIALGEPLSPFSLDLTVDRGKIETAKNKKVAEMIIQLSRLKYGRDRAVVEAEINKRARL